MEWISVKDNKPKLKVVEENFLEISETIFVLTRSGSRYIGYIQRIRGNRKVSCSFIGTHIDRYNMNFVEVFIDPAEITHWMPLPEPPEEEPCRR